jgi:hypothetical protein
MYLPLLHLLRYQQSPTALCLIAKSLPQKLNVFNVNKVIMSSQMELVLKLIQTVLVYFFLMVHALHVKLDIQKLQLQMESVLMLQEFVNHFNQMEILVVSAIRDTVNLKEIA